MTQPLNNSQPAGGRRHGATFVLQVLLVGILLAGISAAVGAKTAQADMLVPGQKTVSYCYKIANLKDFPDYTIVATYDPIGNPTVVKDGECEGFYKYSHPTLFATTKAGFDIAQIPRGSNQKTYFTNNPAFVPSKVAIYSVSTVDQKDPRSKVVDVLKIVDITSTELQVEKSSVIYTYENGTTEELPYRNQEERPAPGNSTPVSTTQPNSSSASTTQPNSTPVPASPGPKGSQNPAPTAPGVPALAKDSLQAANPDISWLWYAVVPGLALAGVAFVVIRRKRPNFK